MKCRRLIPLVFLISWFASAQDLASFEKRVTVKKLDNGLTVVLVERPEAPVFSFFTRVNAGSSQDPESQTGLAHMFEHMAFKGTHTIGTNNWPAEQKALEKVEQTYAAYNSYRHEDVGVDPQKLQQLHDDWENAVKDAQQYVVPNQFDEILESNGAEGVNAFTSLDETAYHYSLPANRLELWAYLESDRFIDPVMREFYKERDVVMEERRMRTDSRPIGKLLEQFLAASFTAHPYHRPGLGWPADISSVSATEAFQFFDRYYVPANIVVTVVGDVKPAEAMPLIGKYFGKIPVKPEPGDFATKEPPQTAVRRVVLEEQAQPIYLEGYHRPGFRDPDDAVYDGITDLMSNGRTSRLYRALVRDRKIAAFAAGFSGLPGVKYPHLFAFYAVPLPGHTPEQMGEAIHAEIEKIKNQDISDEELTMIKTRAKASLIRSLGDNGGLAQQIGTYQALYGDWRELFHSVDRIDRITKADIRRVASKTFVETNRTVGIIETKARPGAPAGAAQPQGANEQ